jgi:hypothetical protein
MFDYTSQISPDKRNNESPPKLPENGFLQNKVKKESNRKAYQKICESNIEVIVEQAVYPPTSTISQLFPDILQPTLS